MVILGTFDDVRLLKSDPGIGWVDLVDENASYRVQLLCDDTTDRLVVVFKQKAPENKVLYRATATVDMTVKKLGEDLIQIQITTGVIFGVKFRDKDFVNPGKFLVHFKNSEAKVIDQVAQSLAVNQKPKQQPDFYTTVPIHRDMTDYREQGRDVQRMHQAPPPQQQQQQQQQNLVQHHQQQIPPLDGRYGNMQPIGGTQHLPNALQYGANGAPYNGDGAQYGEGRAQYGGGGPHYGGGEPQYGGASHGGGGSPGSIAQNYSRDVKSSPVNQAQHFAYSAEKNQPVASDRWSQGQQFSPVQAWSEPSQKPCSKTTEPQSPDPKPKPSKKAPIKSKKQLENYVRLLEAALHDTDKEYAKEIVKILVDAKKEQGNFSVSFPHVDPDNPKIYFRLKVTIEREIALNEQGILFYLMVTKDSTIEQLQLMIETRLSISHEQQHWIVGNKFVTNKEARLTDFGLNGRGAEVHLFISKGEIGDPPSDVDCVILNNPQPQPWSPNQPYAAHYNMMQSHRQWDGGPHVPENPQPVPYASNNQFYGGTGGQQFGVGGRQRPGGNNFIPEGVAMPPHLPSPPPAPRPPPPPGWTCSFCSAFNKPHRPGCQLCSSDRPADYKPPPDYQPTEEELKWIQDEKLGILRLEEFEKEQKKLQEKQARENYEAMMTVARKNIVPNDEEFECPICFVPIEVGEGVKLRECLHNCCRDCLHDHIMASNDADVLCPCNDQFACGGSITEAEMRALLDDEELDKVHSRGLNLAEGQSRSYHCKTPDCKGWCIYEDDVNEFNCMVCKKKNCLLCKAIHAPQSCKEYQEDLRIKAANDKAAQETQKMIEDMIKNGEAMYCPNKNCGLIIQKKNGCDWIRCSCRTEICWVTKGPRWGPKGKGDTSGGCKCKVDGKKCHPKCGNCH